MVIPFRPSPLNHAPGGPHGYRGGFVTLSVGAQNGIMRAAKSLFDRSYSVPRIELPCPRPCMYAADLVSPTERDNNSRGSRFIASPEAERRVRRGEKSGRKRGREGRCGLQGRRRALPPCPYQHYRRLPISERGANFVKSGGNRGEVRKECDSG